MIDKKNGYISNNFEELECLKDEIIKGVLQHDKKIYIIFKSGFSFWFNSNGAFAIELTNVTQDILNNHKGKLISTKKAIENVLRLAGEEL